MKKFLEETLFIVGLTVFWILVFSYLNFFGIIPISNDDWLKLIACILIAAVLSSWASIRWE